MKRRYFSSLLLSIIVLVVGLGAMYISQRYAGHDAVDTHRYLHEKLNLTPEQDKQLEEIEVKYQKRKLRLEETIRLANRELADAINENPSFSPKVQQAIDKIHNAMGELQKLSLEHLFEMRPILTPEQNKQLNTLITDALYENAHSSH